MATRKRFYKAVTVSKSDDYWLVQLDGKNLRSPSGSLLCLPSLNLAEAIAREWNGQGDEIDASSMPLFSRVGTVLDRVIPQRTALIAELTLYGSNDLLCYHDEQDGLATLQRTSWQPWLDWLFQTYGIKLRHVVGVMPVHQNEASKFITLIAKFDDWRLGVLYRVTTLSGSLVLGLGFTTGRIDSTAFFELAFLDELWQNKKWGTDFEAADRQAALRDEFDEVAQFMELLGSWEV